MNLPNVVQVSGLAASVAGALMLWGAGVALLVAGVELVVAGVALERGS